MCPMVLDMMAVLAVAGGLLSFMLLAWVGTRVVHNTSVSVPSVVLLVFLSTVVASFVWSLWLDSSEVRKQDYMELTGNVCRSFD